MRAPASRPRPGRASRLRFLLIALVAFLVLPTFSTGNGGFTEEQLGELIRADLSNFRIQTRGILEVYRENLTFIDAVVPEGGFVDAIDDINVLTSGATAQYGSAQGAVVNSIRSNVQGFGVDPSNVDQLRGVGGCTDRSIEAWLWGDPIAFSKSLRMSAARQRLSVERFNALTDRFDRFPVKMSVQLFPTVEDKLFLYTPPVVGPRLAIGGIIGGSYRVPEENDARTTACLHGWAPANTLVNLMAEGLGGPFNGSDTSDSTGEWEACLTGLKHGYYKFTADDGSGTDLKEQGFYLTPIKLKF